MSEPIGDMVRRLLPDHTGPLELTKAVLAEVGGDCERMYTVLETVLPMYCRYIIGTSRRKTASIPSTADVPAPASAPLPPAKPAPTAPPPATASNPAPSTRPPISRKQERIRNWWKAQMEEQYNIGPGKGYRKLGLLTYDDLIDSAASRHEMARGNIANATKLEALADALQRYQVEKVQDLPQAVFRDIWESRT